jgi:DNA-binding MarR family transcriptional regulator
VPTDGGDDAARDFVDDLLASWAQSRPDLDVGPVAVATRIGRVRDHLEGETAAVLGIFGLTAPSFVMLVTLARLRGTSAAVTEAELAAALGLTPGGAGVRIDRLAGDGIVMRRPDGAVDLTERGRELVEEVVPAHLDNQARLLSALSAQEQDTLAGLLRKLLLSLEQPLGAL